MELVRISTAGSVDDGKSTLIGRLLFDNNALTKEQEALVAKKTAEKGWEDPDLSVITDGLIAEREQGITIDVANIYFSTDTHKFIIADSPGHVEYTRNMVTGASTADTSIILIDARKGLLEQSYRHFYISRLLRLDRVIFAVNKMDLVDYNQDEFLKIAVEIERMVKAHNSSLQYSVVPVSSLKGDNVVKASENMSWYQGKTLNELLHAQVSSKQDQAPFRFDVQQVFHSQENGYVDYRGYAGRVVSGEVSVGDTLRVLPSNKESVVTEIRRYTETKDSAKEGDSIAISFKDELDISRGVMLAHPNSAPEVKQQISATLVWMDEKQAIPGSKWLMKAGSREFAVRLQEIHSKIDPVNAVENNTTEGIELNDIANVEIRLSQPFFFDTYESNKPNGVFILIDLQSNNTVAVGFVK